MRQATYLMAHLDGYSNKNVTSSPVLVLVCASTHTGKGELMDGTYLPVQLYVLTVRLKTDMSIGKHVLRKKNTGHQNTLLKNLLKVDLNLLKQDLGIFIIGASYMQES